MPWTEQLEQRVECRPATGDIVLDICEQALPACVQLNSAEDGEDLRLIFIEASGRHQEGERRRIGEGGMKQCPGFGDGIIKPGGRVSIRSAY
jgi:hypothetical protein